MAARLYNGAQVGLCQSETFPTVLLFRPSSLGELRFVLFGPRKWRGSVGGANNHALPVEATIRGALRHGAIERSAT